ncbi:phosphate ABC transporter substrate-binding protein [Psychrosphaera sp. B3R10]|uniref:Phosphate ABC transporter substrate-binding protein n=1 Tax=Psychrosphaera algicola TaxID=3023714 RepID=A0ABT5FFS1_9GAMM|nr:MULTISPECIES: phosphate ABC transporter substrate-binding protein [unclassified Psychrosphaera]MBU2883260.1 phosphate ABC transporter substrate-binding protein [Psychrosphaera sp. I2R16]MBU2990646.1 phosphate ABC transporter substrate-binding protein [Psychrosphaera sp. B3R10]MDC2889884.1 phosphate ABC transporter substrate-binding protein [Psychrosphaera sp. G1-22]MDO6718880.1 phosphate ABC transporter substrate-binding protein [Psychrosphaera sp. 1_MG-2023]
MKKLLKLSIACFALLASTASFAEIAVIVHPSNNAELDSNAISRLFLGKLKSFPGGDQAVPINLSESSAQTKEFNKNVLKKSGSQLKAYWSKLVFTGKGTPPKALNSDAEVIGLVSSNPNIIGYIDAASVTGDVKVIAKF